MLITFFRKSKLINFFVVTLLAAVAYIIFNFTGSKTESGALFFLLKAGVFIVFAFFLFFLNFILVKNKSEGRHSYVLFLAFIFCLAAPSTLTDSAIILSGFFVALGLWRTLGMQTGKNLPKKIFDSFFCFSVASLFFPTSLIFMLVPGFGILCYAPNNYKTWLIPSMAILCVFILQTAFMLAVYDQFFNPLAYYSFGLIDHSLLKSPQFLWPGLLYVLFVIWAYFNITTNTIKMTQVEKNATFLLFITLIASLGTLLFANTSSRAMLLFLIIPAALIGGRYFEIRKHRRLKEILLISLSLVGLFLAILFKGAFI